MSSVPHSVFNLSPAEKLQLVQDLWDDLAATPENVPVYDWQLEELERRRENLRKAPETARDWDVVLAELRAKYG